MEDVLGKILGGGSVMENTKMVNSRKILKIGLITNIYYF